jgi:5-methylthioribose kinase
MDYRDLDAEKVKEYITTVCGLFRDTDVEVYEIGRNEVDGDGWVNHVYRVGDGKGHSVIVKQAKPWLKYYGEGVMALSVDRNRSEAQSMILRSAIVPQFLPKMYHIDYDNNLYVCEDLARLDIMRFGLAKGKRYPRFPYLMGEYIAKTNFFSSELYLEPAEWRSLAARLTVNDMAGIMESILFTRAPLHDDIVEYPDGSLHRLLSEGMWDRKALRLELLRMRDVFMKKGECLIHGDLHTSNTLIDECEMKIIDMEYSRLGPYSADSGYLLGNFVFTYDTWFYHREGTAAERRSYRAEILSYIKKTLTEYIRVFSECWKTHVRELYRDYPEMLAGILSAYLTETAGFMGSEIISRVSAYAETYDFDILPGQGDRNMARAMCLATGYNLLMQRHTVQSPEDIIQIIQDSARFFLKKTGFDTPS